MAIAYSLLGFRHCYRCGAFHNTGSGNLCLGCEIIQTTGGHDVTCATCGATLTAAMVATHRCKIDVVNMAGEKIDMTGFALCCQFCYRKLDPGEQCGCERPRRIPRLSRREVDPVVLSADDAEVDEAGKVPRWRAIAQEMWDEVEEVRLKEEARSYGNATLQICAGCRRATISNGVCLNADCPHARPKLPPIKPRSSERKREAHPCPVWMLSWDHCIECGRMLVEIKITPGERRFALRFHRTMEDLVARGGYDTPETRRELARWFGRVVGAMCEGLCAAHKTLSDDETERLRDAGLRAKRIGTGQRIVWRPEFVKP